MLFRLKYFASGKPAHVAVFQNLAAVYQDSTPFLLEREVTTAEEVASLQAQMLEDAQAASFNAVGFYLTVEGFSPPQATRFEPVVRRVLALARVSILPGENGEKLVKEASPSLDLVRKHCQTNRRTSQCHSSIA